MPSERAAALCLAALLALLQTAYAAEPVPEHDLKAAFIFNFAVFTEWPQEALAGGAPLAVCAGASNALLPALQQLTDKLVNGHRISVRAGTRPVRGCHVLVLDRADREQWPQLRRELAGAPVLTVADDPASGADGAMIVLNMDEQRVGFDIDMGAAKSARLILSSKLLRLARSVQ